jgi:N-acetylated-alpha-linked acidic dipeptidase
MNTPLDRALDIVNNEGVTVWKADIEETIEEGDPAGEYAHTIGAWHGLSAPGDVTVRLAHSIRLWLISTLYITLI